MVAHNLRPWKLVKVCSHVLITLVLSYDGKIKDVCLSFKTMDEILQKLWTSIFVRLKVAPVRYYIDSIVSQLKVQTQATL